MIPKITYKSNKILDKRMSLSFLDIQVGGWDFSNGIIGVHPELKGINTRNKIYQKKEINIHFDSFYKEYGQYLKKRIHEFQLDWDKVEKKYFQEVNRVFNNYSWPKGRYVGFLSIVDCNPRFLADKTFQVFYLHPDGSIYVTVHELLHFCFYEYCLKNYSNIFKKLDTENGSFWDLAEIFNVVILSQPEFVKIHKLKKIFVYPEHRKYIQFLKRLWQREKDIDNWIVKGFEYLKK